MDDCDSGKSNCKEDLKNKKNKPIEKLRRTLDSMLEQMKTNENEINYRQENFENVDVVKEYWKFLKCTKCGKNFQNSINKGQKIGVHPILGVLMCDSCCDFYGDGDFSLGSDGEDKYCRWCGEGGTIFVCSKCICGFCDKCINKHFGSDALEKVKKDDDWLCYFCNPKPLWYLRSICSLAEKSAKIKKGDSKKNKQEKINKEAHNARIKNKDTSSDSNSSIINHVQRKRSSCKRLNKKILESDSSSTTTDYILPSENEKENKIQSTRKGYKRSSRLPLTRQQSTDSETRNPKKRQKVISSSSDEREKLESENNISSPFQEKKNSALEKLKGIWKLTQIVGEVGLNTSKGRLKKLSRCEDFPTFESLQKEYKKLESLITVMFSSINTARNSIGSITKDLSFDNVRDEKEIYENQEIILKGVAKKVEAESDDDLGDGKSESCPESHVGVDGCSSVPESKVKARRPSKIKRSVDSSNKNNVSLVDIPKSSDSESGKNEKYKNVGKSNDAKKPMLKVKSFAKMFCGNYIKNSEVEEVKKATPEIITIPIDEYNIETDTDEELREKSKEKMKQKKVRKKESSESSKESDSNMNLFSLRTRKDKKLRQANFEKFKRKREKFFKATSSKEGENFPSKKLSIDSDSDSEKEVSKGRSSFEKPRRSRRINLINDSSDEGKEEKLNEKSDSSSDGTKCSEKSSESESEKSQKNKNHSDSDSKKMCSDKTSSDEDDEKCKKKESNCRENKTNRRKNIKKILKKEYLHLETKEALKREEERKERLEARHKLFQELFPEDEDSPKSLILDFDEETKKPTVVVHKKLMKNLKPHQVKGVRFMWDNCFESCQRMVEDSGSGCILAHCMGLGKTLQVVTLVHTLLTHDLGVNSVLIVCPLSTVSNWNNEFEMWLANINTNPIVLFELVKYRKVEERCFYLQEWHKSGGVLIISYDLFRTLTKDIMQKSKKFKKSKMSKSMEVFETALLDPGPDLVVCDEGHLLKNEDSALSKCMSLIKTSRRIVLTGTPLQNNLLEYHCMVQFVKPNILGTKKEFSNRFVNPIINGQFEDSTEWDVKIMKRRSHVLHSMLNGCVQRFDYSVLTPFLPEKHEYVLSISLTETQAKMYRHFIENLTAKTMGSSRATNLFNDYHNLQRIWTHPRTMLMHSEKERREKCEDPEGSLKDFVVNSDESDTSFEESDAEEIPPKKRILRSNANDPEVRKILEDEERTITKEWWMQFFKEEDYEDIRASNKLVVLFSLLKRWCEINDKVLVFSQSLYSLDLIEYFLDKVNQYSRRGANDLWNYKDTWVLGTDYFRLDGSTSSETRTRWCSYFNKKSNSRARLFLISTRAGGLGINLFGANRVVIFDASWNPSHDLQSIFRVYRFGQKKTCYIYRFLAEATMEEKIYERQVTKLSLAHRVVDEHQIERHYSMMNLQDLYNYDPISVEKRKIPKLPKDTIFADILATHKDIIVKYHEHDSLLQNQQEEELSEEERKAAWAEYEQEKSQRAFAFRSEAQQQQTLRQTGFLPEGRGVMEYSYNPAPGVLSTLLRQGNQLTPGQVHINPLFYNSTIPLNVLQKGIQLGVAPFFNETLESYFSRINCRERWMQVEGGPRET